MDIEIRKARLSEEDNSDLEAVIESRYVTMRTVCGFEDDYEFSADFQKCTREYFCNSNQVTAIALKEGRVIGNASICYINVMPTFSHPTGKRAHIMNVYVDSAFRHQKIATKMMDFLIQDAKAKRVTEISLDATIEGRPLYEKLGFTATEEGMVLNL